MITALVCDYRRVTVSSEAQEKSSWLYDAAEKRLPPWTVQLTVRIDFEGKQYILDTTDGTISRRYCRVNGEYLPTYAANGPRSWRDRYTEPETVTLDEWLDQWKQKYLKTTVLTIPPDYGGCGSPSIILGRFDGKPDCYNYEEMHGMRMIYREYGWSVVENYRKEACIQALKLWYKVFRQHQREQLQIETLLEWEQQGISIPEIPKVDSVWRSKV
ncbi:hypothetical protein G6011_06253 [Alternaria panax]|uniref:Uncharacterized protein n=1 Tax=Alternaria panax TaxID=48097 RepID=A0AAD4FG05_9PLEO|nr:hypothetical protein G6011_06253 [Alternaria panax]